MTSQQPFRPTVSAELQGYLDIIATWQGRPTLFIVSYLNNRVTEELSEYLSRYSWHEKYDELSVLMHSLGGDPKETYRMMLILRLHMDDIEVLVPQEAKSAATLFCLGANKILMGSMGELGPLDMQLVRTDEHGHKHRRSTLDSFKASEQMLNHTILAFQKIIGNTPLNASQANPQRSPLEEHNANELMASIVSNLYQKFDPDELGKDSRYLAVGEQYARQLLSRANYEESKAQVIAQRLVWEYPSHDFLIDLHEAKEIGLNIEYLDERFSKFYEVVLAKICEDRTVDHHYELLDGDYEFDLFVALGIPAENDKQVGATDGSGDGATKENDEQVAATDGSDDEGDDDATKE